ncbi:patatin-like phospholipase family protein [Haloarculaceae archaeon H-GB2-1]|nr:patatin-like phospholipase family protein [Haloarculaceae archaeon H-GB1-1]MEA5387681.1 patatin-like phospholipase family protein [Haloarculaceae archaeon H-GB11]MEA5409168.1 patatin-like phospholipase family protein [Haloarculaceae archaeon H-GB2-1]
MSTTPETNVAIACQGGGSHTAFTAGVLQKLLPNMPDDHTLVALSGTSGGALCATTAWYGLLVGDETEAVERLDALWHDLSARTVVEQSLNDTGVLLTSMESQGVPLPKMSPYLNPLSELGHTEVRRVLERQVDFDELPELAGDDDPNLFVSSVNVADGKFTIHDGTDLTADEVLASTAVPTLFEAVTLADDPHWDGLFSQNPPIRNFLSDIPEAERKPDEIWIVQINPMTRATEPKSTEAIDDRRNELAGNLSLMQEVEFIEQVNEWVADESLTPDRYKHVDVRWIQLDMDLSYSSKLNRDPSFVEHLMELGRTKAASFLS